MKDYIFKLNELFKDYIRILKAIEKSHSKGEVQDLEMSLSNLKDEIIKYLGVD